MTRRRFFAPPNAFSHDQQLVTLQADEARHLRNVLRLKPGDSAYVFDGSGGEFRCVVRGAEGDQAVLTIDERVEPTSAESPLNLTLAVALLKGEKFELVLQKATELGVKTVVPVATRYADVQLRDARDAQKRLVRWQRIALEAAKQSGRAVVPIVSGLMPFRNVLVVNPGGRRLMFSERDGKPLAEACDGSKGTQAITALIGSEGGWSDEEINEARSAGWEIVTLGGRILRAETAGIIVTALLQHIYGDLR
jgi:16S rRNA (uracil1498-N3)-methyltransferase